MAALLYYVLIKPLSYLPLGVLYVFSDIIYLVAYKVIGYRKEVVVTNLKNSFPDLSEDEIKDLTRKFYSHFSDLIVESLKLFSISQEEVINRCKILNPEVVDELYDEGKNIIIVGGHYNNWEMLAVSLVMQIKHQVYGIYTPLSSPFFNKKFAESRTKYGTGIVPKKGVPKYFRETELPLKATVFGADQSPQFVNPKTYWTTFMNQDTPIMFGTEKYAVEYDLPVVFVAISKKKRGYYEMEFSLLEKNPMGSEYCSITEKHTRILEKQINLAPEFYLWTHKRWKHKRN